MAGQCSCKKGDRVPRVPLLCEQCDGEPGLIPFSISTAENHWWTSHPWHPAAANYG